MASIELKNIERSFDNKKILSGISFKVKEGEMISLLGESGCGKSTTLNIIAGILKPDSGTVLFNGVCCSSTPIEKRGAVVVFQEHLLFPHLTVEGNIGFGLKMAKVDKKKRKDKVDEILELIELKGFENRYPSELSGGQRQRVAIGRALAVEPKVLLLDEPFSSLDARTKETMRELVKDLQRKLKITTILVTHDKEEALMMSDRIALMIDGVIVQYDTPENIYERPNSPKVADFFGENNCFYGEIHNGVFTSNILSLKTDENMEGNIMALVRPEDIKLNSNSSSQGIEAVIVKRSYGGDRIHYILQSGDNIIKCITARDMDFSEGQLVWFNFDSSRVIFYCEK